MQIQLKQGEIESALKMYIAAQGIAMAGKTVDIAFTSGRKNNGLTADVHIQDGIAVAGKVMPAMTVVAVPAPAGNETKVQMAEAEVDMSQPGPVAGKSLFG